MTKHVCATCRFWQPVVGDKDKRDRGVCRIKPPTFHPYAVRGGETDGEWPQTSATDWCGEWWYKPGEEESANVG